MQCGQYRARILKKFKETIVKYLLRDNGIPVIHNKRISSRGSAFRPDFRIASPFGMIICEVDEHQHKRGDYTESAEKSRMIDLYYDIQIICPGVQVLILRMNPDSYVGVKVELKKRHAYLCQLFHHFLTQPSIGMPLGVIYLFYDGFDGTTRIQPLPLTVVEQRAQEAPTM
jgi:hypothetical protein